MNVLKNKGVDCEFQFEWLGHVLFAELEVGDEALGADSGNWTLSKSISSTGVFYCYFSFVKVLVSGAIIGHI
jgi:hypothetical protein